MHKVPNLSDRIGYYSIGTRQHFNPVLFSLVSNLKYDSVKVYNINCEIKDIKPFSIPMDKPAVYFRKYKSRDSTTCGYTLKTNDVLRLLYILKYAHKDYWGDDPIGFFFPVIGVGFFKNGRVVANLEYSTISLGMTIHICRKSNKAYKLYWVTVGDAMGSYFDSLCSKYELTCCKKKKVW